MLSSSLNGISLLIDEQDVIRVAARQHNPRTDTRSIRSINVSPTNRPWRFILSMCLVAVTTVAIPSVADAAAVDCGGIVFEDFDNDGERAEDYSHVDAAFGGQTDPGLAGAQVTVTDAAGTIFTDTSNADGEWSVTVDDANFPIRVEFTAPSGFLSTQVGPDAGTTVQFITSAADCSSSSGNSASGNVGFALPGSYCATAPELATSCFLFGDVANHDSEAAVVILPDGAVDNRASDGSPFQVDSYSVAATLGEVGSVSGIDSSGDGTIFAGSFVKRHTQIGPTGNPTTIYAIPAGGSASAWFSTDAGAADPHTGASDGWRNDFGAFEDVYTTGLGDVEISVDGKTLYTVDLGRKMLVAVGITPTGAPGAVTETPITAAALGAPCADVDVRPYGLGMRPDGTLFVGVVCSAESTVDLTAFPIDRTTGLDQNGNPVGDASQLTGHIFTFNGSSFNQVMTWNFSDFDGRGTQTGANTFQAQSDWRPWVSQSPYAEPFSSYGWPDQGHAFAQPAITDIDFDGDDLVIGIGDRYAHQKGADAFYIGADGVTYSSGQPISSGDLLQATASGSTYAFAPAAPAEFFEDNYGGSHTEITLGSIAQIPGRPYTISNSFDSIPEPNTWRSGGLTWFDSNTGAQVSGYRLYSGHPNYVDEGTFEKAAGVGDLEALCGAAPIEVGNFVWFDADRDGQQDPGETVMAGVVIELFDAFGNLVATTTTDANGEYYFNGSNVPSGLVPGAGYTIQIAQTNYDAGGVFAPGGAYEEHAVLTAADQGGDQTDSDAGLNVAGLPAIDIIAGDDASTSAIESPANHTYDFGFTTPVFDLALQKTHAEGPANYVAGETVTFDVTITNQGAAVQTVTITDYVNANFVFDAADNAALSGTDSTGSAFTGTWATAAAGAEATIDFGSASFVTGDTVTVPITLQIAAAWDGSEFINWAEISNFDNDGSPANGDAAGGQLTDEDSTPDATIGNDNQPLGPGQPGDDVIDNTDGDEDDHDVAGVPPVYDVALINTLGAGETPVVNPDGDLTVTFTITVKNQGANPVTDVSVVDYLPTGTTFTSFGGVTEGTANVTNVGGDAATQNFNIDALAPGECVSFDLTVTITDPALGTYTNGAEVSSMSDTTGNPVADIDSTPDAINSDDIITTPGIDPAGIDDNNSHNDINFDRTDAGAPIDTTSNAVAEADRDEDDHDQEVVTLAFEFYYDLALVKQLTAPTVLVPGGNADFTIEVTNQGNLAVGQVDVVDYIDNTTWEAFSIASQANGGTGTVTSTLGETINYQWLPAGDAGFAPVVRLTGNLGVDDSVVVPVNLTARADLRVASAENWAEISRFDNDADPLNGDSLSMPADFIDVDSTPDTTLANDNQPTGAGAPGDNVIDNTGGDEDDHDVAGVPVEFFDLALIKVLSDPSAIVAPGDDVAFTITVTNQGTVDATNITIVDYLPAGLTLSATDTNGWVASGDNVQTVVPGPLAAGQSVDLTIITTVDNGLNTGQLVNWAEIAGAADETGTPRVDVDSTPDTDPANDAGGDPATNDNVIDNTDGDEDDHDPAIVSVGRDYDLVLTKTAISVDQDARQITWDITVTNNGPSAALGPITVVDPLKAGLTFVSATSTSMTCALDRQVLTCTSPNNLAAGETISVQILTDVSSDVKTITNSASASAADGVETEVVDDNNVDVEAVTFTVEPSSTVTTVPATTGTQAPRTPQAPPVLAFTGSTTNAFLAIAVLLMVSGGLLLGARRRFEDDAEVAE